MQSTLTSKGQITIPSALRRKLHLKAGDVLDFDENASFLKATKQVDEKRMRSVLGRGKRKLQGKTSHEWLEELRGPVELP
jgi:AbrB family looped-hinge helix DNA binding protein